MELRLQRLPGAVDIFADTGVQDDVEAVTVHAAALVPGRNVG